MSMDTAADPANYTVEELTRLIEDLKHEEPEVSVHFNVSSARMPVFHISFHGEWRCKL